MSATSEDRSRSRASKDFRVVFAASVWTVMTLIAAVLLSRRLAGAFGTARTVALTCAAGTVATLFSLAAHALWTAANPTADGRRRAIVAVLSVLIPLVVADVLWTTPSAFSAGYLVALFILAGLATLSMCDLVPVASWESLQQGQSLSSAPVETAPEPEKITLPVPAAHNPLHAHGVALSFEEAVDEESCDEVDPTLAQSIVRGTGRWRGNRGGNRSDFFPGRRADCRRARELCSAPGQRPRAECHVLSGFDGRVRIGLVQAYGLRDRGPPVRAGRRRDRRGCRILCRSACRPMRGGLTGRGRRQAVYRQTPLCQSASKLLARAGLP